MRLRTTEAEKRESDKGAKRNELRNEGKIQSLTRAEWQVALRQLHHTHQVPVTSGELGLQGCPGCRDTVLRILGHASEGNGSRARARATCHSPPRANQVLLKCFGNQCVRTGKHLGDQITRYGSLDQQETEAQSDECLGKAV